MNPFSDPLLENDLAINRRQFFGKSATGIGGAALAYMLGSTGLSASPSETPYRVFPGIAPKAKRVIYLFQSGAPSQHDLFDHKPELEKLHGKELPSEVRGDQRVTGMTKNQKSFPLTKSPFKFAQAGKSGATISELLPHNREIADDICYIKSMHTEAINHDPAITFFQTGSQIPGRPSMGSWLTYGLGSENANLPGYVVMVSKGSGRKQSQPVYDRLWGSGFLSTSHQGVRFRSAGDPVLYLRNPDGVPRDMRRKFLDNLAAMNQQHMDRVLDPEIQTRIKQYEMAYRMQMSVPDLADISKEPKHVLDLYGPDVTRPGSYAYNCLMARRMAERGVRFTQLFHQGWDHHDNLVPHLTAQCRDTDRASTGLIKDLKQRGLLKDTLVIWGGEFGRTVYTQGKFGSSGAGRDHHPRCFTTWAAGGGIKPGITHGKTDEYGYNIIEDPVHVHDFHATMLHLLGIDHEKLTYRYQGRYFRLTDVHGKVVNKILT